MHDSRIEFRHPLARSAVYGDSPAERRRVVHRALADALPDADADRRAWHLALASFGPDDVASSALEQAGQRAHQRSAYEVASRAFERAARLAPEEARQGRLLYAAADAAWLGGLADWAGALLDEAGLHTPAPELAVSIEQLQGHIATRRGPVTEAQQILLAAADGAPPCRVSLQQERRPTSGTADAIVRTGTASWPMTSAAPAWPSCPTGRSPPTASNHTTTCGSLEA